MSPDQMKTAQMYVDQIQRACGPGRMTQEEAHEFLEEIAGQLQTAADAIREELDEGEGADMEAEDEEDGA